MAELLEKALSPAVLNAAWKRLQNEKTVWKPGLPRWEMERNLVLHLQELVDDLRSGRYGRRRCASSPFSREMARQRVLSALESARQGSAAGSADGTGSAGRTVVPQRQFGYRPRRTPRWRTVAPVSGFVVV